MKIVHLLAPASAGGLERVVQALAIGQQQRGHEVTVVPIVTEWLADNAFAMPLARAGVPVLPVVHPPKAYLRGRSLIKAVFRQLRPDVMHSHGYHADLLGGDLARRLHIATVSTLHGFTRGDRKNLIYEWLDRKALGRFDQVIAVSQPIADELIESGVPPERLSVVANAWSQVSTPIERDAARIALHISLSAFVVGWVGRMSREKGLDVLIDALPHLQDLRLTIFPIGDGPEQPVQQKRARGLGVAESIQWGGLQPEAARYFRAFDVLVLSSRTEGVPMVIFEAVAVGVPLVATAVGGIPNTLSSADALLVRSEDPVALAKAIRHVHDAPLEAEARARSARLRLDREFNADQWWSRYEDIYRRACTKSVDRTHDG